MDDIRTRALEAAYAWIGTPYMLGAALRGVGADCVGLVRGVYADVTGQPIPPAPPWRQDWVADRARPLVTAARKYLHPLDSTEAAPGDVVVLRMQGGREAHAGILAPDDHLIHAQEGVGVVLVPFTAFRPQIAFAAAI